MAKETSPGMKDFADETSNEDSLQCVGFNLMSFTIPAAHKYGNCRPVSEFQQLHTIAQGSFGTVYKVKDCKTNKIYALKKLKKRNSGVENAQVLPQNFLRQITNLKKIQHLNIVNLKEVVAGKNPECNYLLLDYCEYTLENVIDVVDAVFIKQRQIKNIMKQLLSGLKFIHRFNIIHRDLCPKNILFTETGILKISDFGSSRMSSDVDMTPNHGLRWYRAPEILFGSLKYTKAVDVWATGCIFAEMMIQKPLFGGNSDTDIVKSLIQLLGSPSERQWPDYSNLPIPQLYHFEEQLYNRLEDVVSNQNCATVSYLRKFLQYNPASRPNVEDLVEDRYYEEYPPGCTNDVLLVTLRMSKTM